MTHRLKKLFLFSAIFFAVFFCSGENRLSALATPADPASREDLATVRRVIDGDTFDLESGERVRLIGVDTPEYQPWKNRVDFFGKEASEFTRKLLTGKKVLLEKDADPKDNYGRTLAYVYLEDGRFVNLLLVEEGYARAKYYSPNGRHYLEFKRSQDKARRSKKGLWTKP